LRANIEAGAFVQFGVVDREFAMLAWLAELVTQIAQAKARIRKILLAELCLKLITQVRSRTNVSPTSFIALLPFLDGRCGGLNHPTFVMSGRAGILPSSLPGAR
jgi:hypothetical protein